MTRYASLATIWAARVATLDHDLRQSGGRLLARARWQLDQNQFTEAINTLTTFLKQEHGSPALTEARSLLHRAQLESALDLAAVEGAHYDPGKALAALDAITKEPFDSFVATAALAEAALKLTQGQSSEAEALMGKTLDSWVTTQRDLIRQPPISSIDADVAEIRQVVFRPLGDLPIYDGSGWNAFNFSGGAASLHRGARRHPSEDFRWPSWSAHCVSAIPGSRSRAVTQVR